MSFKYKSYFDNNSDDIVIQPDNTENGIDRKQSITQSGGNRYVSTLPVSAMAELMNKLQSKSLQSNNRNGSQSTTPTPAKPIDTSSINPIAVIPGTTDIDTTAIPIQSNNISPVRRAPPPIPTHLLQQQQQQNHTNIDYSSPQPNGTATTNGINSSTSLQSDSASLSSVPVRSTPPPLPVITVTTPTSTSTSSTAQQQTPTSTSYKPTTPPRLANRAALSILTGKSPQHSNSTTPTSSRPNSSRTATPDSTDNTVVRASTPPARPRRPVVQISELLKQEQQKQPDSGNQSDDNLTVLTIHNHSASPSQRSMNGDEQQQRSNAATPIQELQNESHTTSDGDSDSSLVHHVELVAAAEDDTSTILSRQQSDAAAKQYASKQDNEIQTILNQMSEQDKQQVESQSVQSVLKRPPPLPVEPNINREISTSSIYATDMTRGSSTLSDVERNISTSSAVNNTNSDDAVKPIVTLSTASIVPIPEDTELSNSTESTVVRLHTENATTSPTILYNKSPSNNRTQSFPALDTVSSSPLSGNARKLLAPSLKQHMLAKSAQASPVIKERRLFTQSFAESSQPIPIAETSAERTQSVPVNTGSTITGMKPPPLPAFITAASTAATIPTPPPQASISEPPAPISAQSTARHVRQSSNSNTRTMMQTHTSELNDYIESFCINSAVDTDNEFYKLVYEYKQQNSYVEETLYRIASLQSQIDKQADAMWSLGNVERTEEATCRDNVKFQHTISAQTCTFDNVQLDSLQQQLTKLRDISVHDISTHRFAAQTAQLNIELYINQLLTDVSGFESGVLNSRSNSVDNSNETVERSTSVPSTPRHNRRGNSCNNDSIQKLRQCIDVLFHFATNRDTKQQQLHTLYQKLQNLAHSDGNKSHDVVDAVLSSERDEMYQFQHNIRKWCKIVVETLYTYGDVEQHQYVFCHMLRCKNVTQWANFLQFTIANNKCTQRDHINHDQPEQVNWEFNTAFTKHMHSMLMLLLSTESHMMLNKTYKPIDLMKSPLSDTISEQKSDTSSENKSDSTTATNVKSNSNLTVDTQPNEKTDEDWILVENQAEVPSHIQLSEHDFVTLLQQFPILPFLRHTFLPLFSSHIAQHHCDVLPHIANEAEEHDGDLQTDKQQLTDAIAQLQYIVQLCTNALTLVNSYQGVGKYIASLMISLPTLISECYKEASQSMNQVDNVLDNADDNANNNRIVHFGTGLQPYACCENEYKNWWSVVSIQLDACIIQTMNALLRAPQYEARHIITQVPYSLLSSIGAGQAMIALMTSIQDIDDIQQTQVPLTLPKWLNAVQHELNVKLFSQQLAKTNIDNTHIIKAIVTLSSCNYVQTNYLQPPIDTTSSMTDQVMHEYNTLYNDMYVIAAQLRQKQHRYDYVPPWTDIPLIAVYELFTIGFLDRSTRSKYHTHAVSSIAHICNTHHICISLLLTLIYYHADTAGPILLDLLNRIELRTWLPTSTDMNLVQSLLATSPASLSCQLGIKLIKSLDYTVVAQTDTSGQCIKPLNSRPKLGYIFNHSLLCLLCDVRAYHNTKSASYIMPLTAFNKLPQIQFPTLHQTIQQYKQQLSQQSVPTSPLARSQSTASTAPPSPEHRRALSIQSTASPSLTSRMTDGMNSMIQSASAAVGYNTVNALSDDFWLSILQRLCIRTMHGTVQFPVLRGYLCQRWHKQAQSMNTHCTYKRINTRNKEELKQQADHDEYIKLINTDPILSYLQLMLTDMGTSLPIFLNEGWSMCYGLLRHPLYRVLGLRVLYDLLPTLVQQSYEMSHLYMPVRQTQPPPAYNQSRTPSVSPNSRSISLSQLQHSSSQSQLNSEPQASPRSLGDISPNNRRQMSVTSTVSMQQMQKQKPVTPQLNTLGKALLQRLQSLADTDKPSTLKSLVGKSSDEQSIVGELPTVAGTHIMSYNNDLHSSMLACSPYLLLDYWLHCIVACGMSTPAGNWLRDTNSRITMDRVICNVLTWTDLTSEPHTGTLLTFNTNSMVGVLNRFLYSISRRDATPVNVQVLDDNDDSQVSNIQPSPLKPGQKPGQDPIKVDRHTATAILPPASLLTSLGPTAYIDIIPAHTYLSFAILLQETRSDRHGWLTLGSYMSNWDCEVPTKQLFQRSNLGNKVIRHESMLRRWLIAAINCPVEHPLLPLYWQMAFKLWMSRVTPSQPVSHNSGGFYGFRLLTGYSGKELTMAVAGRLDELTDLLTQRRLDALHHTPDPTTIHPAVMNLPALFQAMTLWFRPGGIEPPPHATSVHTWLNELRLRCMGHGNPLNETYLPHRLAPLVCSVASQHIPLWWDLVDMSSNAFITCTKSIHLVPTPITYQPTTDTFSEWIRRHDERLHRITTLTQCPPNLYAVEPLSRSRTNHSVTHSTLPMISNMSVSLAQPVCGGSDILELPEVITQPVWHLFDLSAAQCQYLAEVAQNYTERYQHRVALDTEYIQLLPTLWRNEPTQLSVDKPCKQSITNNRTCSGMARFTFKFNAGVKQDEIVHSIKANRDTAIQYSMIQCDYNDLVFVAQICAISNAMKYIAQQYNQPTLTEPKQQLYVNSGIAWLYALCQIDSEYLRGYTPVWQFVQNSVAMLAPIVTHPFVNSLQQQAQLLDVMSAHPHLVDQLYSAIDTSTAIQHTHNESYLLFYQHSIGIKTAIGLSSLKLLQQCNLQQWLETSPSLEQQVFVLTHTFNAVAAEDVAIRKLCEENSNLDISVIDTATATTSYYTNTTLLLLKNNFEQLVDTYIEHLLSCTLTIVLQQNNDIRYKSTWLFTQWAGLANMNLTVLSGMQWITTMRTMSDWLINVREQIQQKLQSDTQQQQQAQKQYIIQLQQYQLLKKQHDTFQSQSKLPPPPIQPAAVQPNTQPLYIHVYKAFDKLLQPMCKFMSVLCKSHILYLDSNTAGLDANQYITINDQAEQKHEYWLSILQLYSALMPYEDSNNDLLSTPVIRHHTLTVLHSLCHVIKYYVGIDQIQWTQKLLQYYTDYVVKHSDILFVSMFQHAVLATSFQPFQSILQNKVKSYATLLPFAQWCLTVQDVTMMYNTVKQICTIDDKANSTVQAIQQKRIKLVTMFIATLVSIADFAYEFTQKQTLEYTIVLLPLISQLRIEIDTGITALVQHMFNTLLFVQWNAVLTVTGSTVESITDEQVVDTHLIKLGQCVNIIRRDILAQPLLQHRMKNDTTQSVAAQLLPTVYDSVPYKLVQHYQLVITDQQKAQYTVVHNTASTMSTVANVVYVHRLLTVTLLPQLHNIATTPLQYTYMLRKCALLVRWLVVPIRDELPSGNLLPLTELTTLFGTILYQLNTLYNDITAVVDSKLIVTILAELLALYNLEQIPPSPSGKQGTAVTGRGLPNELSDILNNLVQHKYAALSLSVISGLTRSITSVDKLVSLLELSIQQYFVKHTASGVPHTDESIQQHTAQWLTIATAIQLPDTVQLDTIQKCVSTSSMYTLHSVIRSTLNNDVQKQLQKLGPTSQQHSNTEQYDSLAELCGIFANRQQFAQLDLLALQQRIDTIVESMDDIQVKSISTPKHADSDSDDMDALKLLSIYRTIVMYQCAVLHCAGLPNVHTQNNTQHTDTLQQLEQRTDITLNRIIKSLYKLYSETKFNWSLVKALSSARYSNKLRITCISIISFIVCHCTAYCNTIKQYCDKLNNKDKNQWITILDNTNAVNTGNSKSNTNINLQYYYNVPHTLQSCPQLFRSNVIQYLQSYTTNKQYSSITTEINKLVQLIEQGTDHTRNISTVSTAYIPLHDLNTLMDQVVSIVYPTYTNWP